MVELKDLYTFSLALGLKDRVAAACWREAKNIFAESDSVTNHTERTRWAIRVLRAVDSEAQVFTEMLKGAVTIRDSGDVSDDDIQATVTITVNHFAMAGV